MKLSPSELIKKRSGRSVNHSFTSAQLSIYKELLDFTPHSEKDPSLRSIKLDISAHNRKYSMELSSTVIWEYLNA